jgi:hypothetical protein
MEELTFQETTAHELVVTIQCTGDYALGVTTPIYQSYDAPVVLLVVAVYGSVIFGGQK